MFVKIRLMKSINLLNLLLGIFLFASVTLYGAPLEHGDDAGHGEKKEFDAGKMIIDHIIDAHDWHIMDIGDHHITVPLPVILIDEGELYVFMSSKFHHGHSSHKGFMLVLEGDYKGKIVRVTEGTMERDTEAAIPLDFSITKTVFATFVSMIILLLIFISVARTYTRRQGEAPKGLQSFLEPIILFVRDDIAKAAIGEKKYEKFLPYLLTIFFFILLNNLMGLIPFFPFGANVTGNLAVTGILALFTLVITLFSANRSYYLHLVNAPGVPWWLKIPIPLMPFVEILGVFTKPFVLMIRLFANITAGHIIILGLMSLIFIFGSMTPVAGYGVSVGTVLVGVFMGLLELLVAFIQAYVFTLLSALYFGMAIEEHH